MNKGAKKVATNDAPMVNIQAKKNRLWLLLSIFLASILVAGAGYGVFIYRNINKNTGEKDNAQQNVILNSGSAPIEIEVKNKQVIGTE